MSEAWEPVCHHGISETQVRQAVLEASTQLWQEQRKALRVEGWPLLALESADKVFAEQLRKHLDAELPLFMKNMALSAGAASEH